MPFVCHQQAPDLRDKLNFIPEMSISLIEKDNKFMDVEIDRTVKTPEVHFSSGMVSISGRSILEDSKLFYHPLTSLMENYSRCNGRIKQIDLSFEYLNGSSTRCLLSMIRVLEKVYAQDSNLVINWYYEEDDDNMKEMGQVFKSLTHLPFNILKSEEKNKLHCPAKSGQH